MATMIGSTIRLEHRAALRRAVRCEAEVQALGGAVAKAGLIYDLSVRGLFIAMDSPPPLGAKVTVSFEPPYCFESVNLTAVVVRIGEHEGDGAQPRVGIGAAFVGLTVDDVFLLEAAIEGLPPRLPSRAPMIAAVRVGDHEPTGEFEALTDGELEHFAVG